MPWWIAAASCHVPNANSPATRQRLSEVMFRALASRLKQFTAAVALLLAIVVTAELVLQFRQPAKQPVVTKRLPPEFQVMLTPSATNHHELKRLSTLQFANGPEIHTNSLGLRGSEPSQDSPDHIRIVVLGDETVFGAQYSEEESFPGRVQQFVTQTSARSIEVVNAGVPGYSPLLSLIQFERELVRLEPDIVILHFDMSDVADDRAYRRFVRESDGAKICSSPLQDRLMAPTSPLIDFFRNSALIRYAAQSAGFAESGTPNRSELYEWTMDRHDDLRLQIQHALTPLEELQQLAEQHRFFLLISTSPVPWQVTSSEDFPGLRSQLSWQAEWPVADNKPMQILEATCQSRAIPLCDTTAAFRSFSQPARLFRPDSVELSNYGNALYAREVVTMLLKSPQVAALFTADRSLSAETREVR